MSGRDEFITLLQLLLCTNHYFSSFCLPNAFATREEEQDEDDSAWNLQPRRYYRFGVYGPVKTLIKIVCSSSPVGTALLLLTTV